MIGPLIQKKFNPGLELKKKLESKFISAKKLNCCVKGKSEH